MGDYEMGELRRDRFSELPSSLILHILSFLPMRDVVSTSLLSKAWNNLWTTVPCLHFSIISESYSPERFRNFVNRVLISWKGTQIQKFEISIGPDCCCTSLGHDFGLWMGFAVEKKVEELSIHLWSEGEVVYETPQCLKSCSTLKKLSLEGCSLRIHGSPTWNQLKSLEIHDSYVSEELINQILSGSPQLDYFDLCIWDSNENLSILSTSLKKLKIIKYAFYEEDDPSLDTTLKICCPNLATLEISGILYDKCFLTNVSSVTDATLGFNEINFDRNELLGETLRQIFPSIQHIEKVTLSSWCVEVLGVSPKKYLPSPLPNVKFLKLNVDDTKVSDIMNILGVFPNLEKLMIEDIPYYDYRSVDDPQPRGLETNLSMSLMLQVKTIEVISSMCDTEMYQLIGFLLKHASMLEKLVIRAKKYVTSESESGSCQETYFLKVAKIVLNMPRSSPIATVIFKTS